MPTTTKDLARVWAIAPNTPPRDPGAEKYALGFVAEIPTYQVLNYLHNRIDQNILALAERGVFAWGNDVTYLKGAKVWDDFDGVIYQAKVASPSKSAPPSQNPNEWEASLVNVPKSQFDRLRNDFDSHAGNYANPHRLTTEQVDTYTRAIIDAMAAKPQGDVDTHIADMNNPHQDTAAKIGAVPVSGGTYGGAVTHATGEVIIGNVGATTAVKTEAGKIFLRSNTYELGVDASGAAYFKNAAGTSLILDEALFLEAKTQEEKNYASPLPATECKLHTDINMYAGVGPVEFTSPGGFAFTDRGGNQRTSGQDEYRIEKFGLAVWSEQEVLELTRTYDGYGWSEGTMEIDFYVPSIADQGQWFLMEDNGFILAKVGIKGTSMDFRWTNSAGAEVVVPLTTALTAGRHRFVLSGAADGRIKFYFDGVLIQSTLTTLPAKGSWTKTRFFRKVNGTSSYNYYMVGCRIWSVVLTDKQVTGL